MKTVHKVYAYITRDGDLLVFRHAGMPEAGIQVPGGTLEPGELPEEGVMREAFEETGVSGLTLLRPLGYNDRDVNNNGMVAVHRRHFFHLACPPGVPETWQHYETHRSDLVDEPILFEFYWINTSQAASILHPYYTAMLPALLNTRQGE